MKGNVQDAIASTQGSIDRINAIGSELHALNEHAKNLGRALTGKERKELTQRNEDKGVLAAIAKPLKRHKAALEGMEKVLQFLRRHRRTRFQYLRHITVFRNHVNAAPRFPRNLGETALRMNFPHTVFDKLAGIASEKSCRRHLVSILAQDFRHVNALSPRNIIYRTHTVHLAEHQSPRRISLIHRWI